MTDQLTHWKKLHNPDFLGSWVLQPEEEIIGTIKSVGNEIVTGPDGKKDECVVAHFKEPHLKPMILNATNCKTIAKIYKTPFIQEWVGKQIQIYMALVNAFGEQVEALRIRPKVPTVKKPELTPEHKKWAGAVNAIRSGGQTVEGIKKYFFLSDENEAALKAEVSGA